MTASKSAAFSDVRITRLENGVVVATETIPKIRSASLGVYLDIGSRDEVLSTNGLAHLFEHMVFKGTEKHNALEIVKVFESTGGQVNAYTSKEQTCFYAKVVDTEVSAGLSMLLEMMLNATFDPKELEKEKEVIIEEIKGGNDSPDDYVYDLFSQACFGDHSLGFPIAGTEKTVKGLSRKHLVNHQSKAANKLPVYVIAVGAVDHREVVGIARRAFSLGGGRSGNGHGKSQGLLLPATGVRKAAPRTRPGAKPRHLVNGRAVHQVTAILGGPGYDWDNPLRYAMILLNCVLGDGMSSKLFQSVREELGLVYNIYSNPEFLVRAGTFAIGFATEPKDLEKAIREINKQIQALKRTGLSADDLDFAKRNIRGGILLGLESTNSRMANVSRQLMYGHAGESIEKTLKKLDQVSLADVRACIADVFDSKLWASAAVMPKQAKFSLGKLLDF